MSALKENISALENLLERNHLEPFIRYIRFPMFKNIEPDTKIDFSFPITALVGANGTNKSSILRAIQGSPTGENIGKYWFSTEIDPIEESPDGAQCFIYGYLNAKEKKIVEVLKTRIKKDEDPDYWEPSRPVAKYGMDKFKTSVAGSSTSKTRWDPVTKNVVYIDFRQSMSAFDKYFYMSDNDSISKKKERIRKSAPHLKEAVKQKKTKYTYYKQRIIDSVNRDLSQDEVDLVSEIIGKKYKEICLINHCFFNTSGFTAILSADGLSYTEAFAGSGEFAIVNLVTKIFSAPEFSLILLDEPEVSLHPGAQIKLMDFISDSIVKNKHQFLISTHSPSIIRGLPSKAVKVFAPDPTSHKIKLLSQSSAPDEAFFHLGEFSGGKRLVVVEDRLAVKLVQKALKKGGEPFYSQFEVKHFPGGSKTLWSHYLPMFANEGRKDVLVLFDGDEKTEETLPDPDNFSVNNEDELKELLVKVSKTNINFYVDGGKNGKDLQQECQLRRAFIKWARAHVRYLPGNQSPEAFIWSHMQIDKEKLKGLEDANIKTRFKMLARRILGRENYEELTSSDILSAQEYCINEIPFEDESLTFLYGQLRDFLENKEVKS